MLRLHVLRLFVNSGSVDFLYRILCQITASKVPGVRYFVHFGKMFSGPGLEYFFEVVCGFGYHFGRAFGHKTASWVDFGSIAQIMQSKRKAGAFRNPGNLGKGGGA